MREERGARFTFFALWIVLLIIKGAIAARLPLFVDEAFYWQESRHLAAAYSDLPGLTAWLIALGTALGGDSLLGVRWPFLALGSLLPWLMVRLAWPLGERQAWQAGLLALLFPLSGFLGVLALPDVPMNVAAVLCLLAGARALRGVDWPAAAWLALGLSVGALSHYRFVGVIAVGFAALLALPQGRRALRDGRVWLAIGLGALAWLPLVFWNLEHGEAGWRFQFVERHPWAPQIEGWRFIAVQAALATPLLLVAMVAAAMRYRVLRSELQRWLALTGGLTVLGFFLLGFVADADRASFHWPLPGYLALLALVPTVLACWLRALRMATWGCLVAACGVALAGQVMVASSDGRVRLAAAGMHPANFAGWTEVAEAARARLATLPEGTRLVADHFKLGAELGFALGDPDIVVLDHPLNHRHGRARQLQAWGLLHEGGRGEWQLLVVGASDVKFSALLAHYQSLCARLGPLSPPEVVDVDGGARRFLLLVLPPDPPPAPCVTPAVAHVDLPGDGDTVGRRFIVRGWAVKDAVGIGRIVVRLDGAVVAVTRREVDNSWVMDFLAGTSRDPGAPRVQFEAVVELPDATAGWRRLSLDLHGGDGSVERWRGPRVRIDPMR
jgi:4-amino-4-deoxy-L-arabinose transferase-like glycosyltransferase